MRVSMPLLHYMLQRYFYFMVHRDHPAFIISTEYFLWLSDIWRCWTLLYVQVVNLYTYMLTIKNIHSTRTVFLCVLFGLQKKQQAFPFTAITVWYLQHIQGDYRSVNRKIYVSQCSIISKATVPWLRQLEFDVRLRRPAFDWRSFHQGIIVDNVALKLGFLLLLRFHSHHGSDEEPQTSHRKVLGSNSGQSICVF